MEYMTESGSQDIKDTDIIFECPHCGKSLAIDYHAAGLSIPCTDCSKLVGVPIPDGMEISDLDNSVEDQGALVIHLREVVLDCQTRMRLLEGMIDGYKKERKQEALRESDNFRQLEHLSRNIDNIRKAVDQIDAELASMAVTIRKHPHPEK